MISLKRPVM